MNYTKKDIIEDLVNQTGLKKKLVKDSVEKVIDILKGTLSSGDRIELRGFGVFSTKLRSAKIGRNPRTGEEVRVEPKFAPVFKASSEFTRILNENKKEE